MSASQFVHLHTHSQYSLLDGLSKVPDLVAHVKAKGMDAVAITDHGSMYGAVEFYEECTKQGVKPIIGEEMYVAPNGRHSKEPRKDDVRYHLTVLAKNNTGYQNLLQLTTKAHLEGYYYKPRIDWELLEEYGEGLIILSGCLNGELSKLIIRGDVDGARAVIKKYHARFGEDYYLEIQPNTLADQLKVNKVLVALSDELGVPLVATQDAHYLKPEDADAQDVLLCLQTKSKKDDPSRLSMAGQDFSVPGPDEMAKRMKEYPRSALENTVAIAKKTSWSLTLGQNVLPHFDVPEGKTDFSYLKELCESGIPKRYPHADAALTKTVDERLAYELSVIEKTGFASYFLIVQDFVNWAKAQGILVGPGRGSAAGSIVAYLTRVTNIDPIQYELLFERFLNPERISMPDIDLDFADTRRDEVIRYVEEKYGKDHVAQIITFGTMAARAVIRDVGRVMNFSYGDCDRLAKLIPFQMTLKDAIETVPEIKQFMKSDPQGQQFLEIALQLEGVARHTSTHACGVLITPEPLSHYAPVQYASSSDKQVVSQYSLHPVEVLGLLKMDFLGLKNMTIIERTRDIVAGMTGEKIDIDTIPLDDPLPYQLLQEGKTKGVFQLESEGMRRYLKQLKPSEFEDIIAMVSLYRPGPMEFIPDYIAGKHGLKRPEYLHPTLEPILKKTYGIAVYQEQVLQMARDLAGFTLGEADVLRKAVGKKIGKLLREQKKKFIDGCVQNGIEKNLAKQIFAFIEPFANYGFNRAHAACYAMIAYQTAYLKAHYPAAFMAALLTADEHDTDRIAILVEECRVMGIEVLPPDVNASLKHFTVVPDSDEKVIRFGMVAIKNVGDGVVEDLIAERKAGGRFATIEEFLERVPQSVLNKKPIESLIMCGAFDELGDRGALLANLEALLAFARNLAREAEANQATLFGDLPKPTLILVDAPPAIKEEMLKWEKALLGLYVTEHPWKQWEGVMQNKSMPIASIDGLSGERVVTIGGVVSGFKRIVTKKGESMAFVTLEDTTGKMEVIVFPRVFADTHTLWEEERIVLVRGKVSTRDDEAKILCDKAMELTKETAERFAEEPLADRGAPPLDIAVSSTTSKETMEELRAVLASYPGTHRVYLHTSAGVIETTLYVDWNADLAELLEPLLGLDAAALRSFENDV
jgi:DNA polymerase III subunit alpha